MASLCMVCSCGGANTHCYVMHGLEAPRGPAECQAGLHLIDPGSLKLPRVCLATLAAGQSGVGSRTSMLIPILACRAENVMETRLLHPVVVHHADHNL